MRIETITSRKNPLIQQIRKLLTSRKARQESGLYVSDGTKLLQEAVRWCDGLETVVVTDSVDVEQIPDHIRVYRVPEDVMESISPMKAPQGAVFLCRIPENRFYSITPGTLILDGIQDPGNVGTILRTADALEIPVVLTGGCADPYNWKTVRASMGAVFRTQPVCMEPEEILNQCRISGIDLATTVLSPHSRDIREVRLGNLATVIGSEGQGVSDLFLRNCNQELIIPMNIRCESLNAATAATIVMWQIKLGN